MTTIKTIMLVISLVVIGQVVNGQCGTHKVRICKLKSGCWDFCLPDEKCVTQNLLDKYLRMGWFVCSYSRIGDSTSPSDNTTSLMVFPNPVSNTATISYTLEHSANVVLKVFDLTGRLVTTLADAAFDEGDHEITWDASEVKSGIYLLRMEAGEEMLTEKLSVVK
jgi:hypothetical protein